MSGFLLDTSVLSMLAPGRPDLSPMHRDWFRRENDGLFVPSLAIAEINEGIAKLRRSGAAARADGLAVWLDALIAGHDDRVLAFETRAAKRAGELSDALRATGRHPAFADTAIAAVAAVNGLTVATRNIRHFEAIGIACTDPFEENG